MSETSDCDLTKLPTSELIRLYMHYCEAVNRWEAKNPTVNGLDSLYSKQKAYAAEIDQRVPSKLA